MTIIFNVFVFYNLFNQINCRVLDDSLNIFKRIDKSYLFLIIESFEIIIQVIIISFGNTVFHTSFMGLTWKQWFISLGFSAITFLISLFAKFINLDKHIDKCLISIEDEEEKSFNDSNSFKIQKLDSEAKLDETNICNKNNQQDNIDILKMSDFELDSEKISNIDSKN